MSDTKAKCGTTSGAVTHRNNGEPVCDACRRAANAYQRAQRAARKAEKAEQDRIWGNVG